MTPKTILRPEAPWKFFRQRAFSQGIKTQVPSLVENIGAMSRKMAWRNRPDHRPTKMWITSAVLIRTCKVVVILIRAQLLKNPRPRLPWRWPLQTRRHCDRENLVARLLHRQNENDLSLLRKQKESSQRLKRYVCSSMFCDVPPRPSITANVMEAWLKTWERGYPYVCVDLGAFNCHMWYCVGNLKKVKS